jgi:hypothetical protein
MNLLVQPLQELLELLFPFGSEVLLLIEVVRHFGRMVLCLTPLVAHFALPLTLDSRPLVVRHRAFLSYALRH